MTTTLISDLGLNFRTPVKADRLFFLALVAPLILTAISLQQPTWEGSMRPGAQQVLSFVLLQPFMEELLFRGVLQGQLRSNQWARRQVAGLSVANYLASLVFVLAHFIHHPPVWAIAVFIPSLIFGFFRDRHAQVYSPLILHVIYNGCYLASATR